MLFKVGLIFLKLNKDMKILPIFLKQTQKYVFLKTVNIFFLLHDVLAKLG